VKAGWLISAFFPQLNRITPEQKKRIPDTRVLMVSFTADEYGKGDKMLSDLRRFVDGCRVLNEKRGLFARTFSIGKQYRKSQG
jgi:hypothetical protein